MLCDNFVFDSLGRLGCKLISESVSLDCFPGKRRTFLQPSQGFFTNKPVLSHNRSCSVLQTMCFWLDHAEGRMDADGQTDGPGVQKKPFHVHGWHVINIRLSPGAPGGRSGSRRCPNSSRTHAKFSPLSTSPKGGRDRSRWREAGVAE